MTLLIIDDRRWQRGLLQRILSTAGYDVIEAADGREGVVLLAESPSAVFCDLLMPDLDGFGFLKAVRSGGFCLPVIIASADIQRTSRERCKSLGARAFVAKPYHTADVLDALRVALTVAA